MPNLKVAAPADATELCALLETALASDGPVAIRFPKGTVPATPDLPVEPIPVGRWEEARRGAEAAIVAIGRMVEVATVAADQLAAEGISCGVINARWLKPIDPRLVGDWARRYPLLVTAEDNVGSGFGSAVLEALAPHGLAGKVRVAALPDRFLAHGKQAEILAQHGLDPDGLAQTVRTALRRAPTPTLPQRVEGDV
jgi:1-deoxy-D-xylulose-5-phosphate synthase